MARTTSAAVILVLSKNYDTVNEPDLTPYIEAASSVIDDVVTCATGKGLTISSTKLELLERYLSAHYYTKMDPTYASKSTMGASASYTKDPKVPEPYKAIALDLDTTGCLNAIMNQARASMLWLGKPPSSQIPYDQRD